MSIAPVWITCPSPAVTAASYRHGPRVWTSLASSTAKSRTPITALVFPSETRMESRSSSSRRRNNNGTSVAISMLTTPRRVDRVENSTPTAGSGWAGPDPLPCADPPVICGGCPVTYVTGGTCRRWVIPRPGDKRAGQGLSIRFGQAGSPTANELRHRLSPTHWPQLNTAYRTNETSSPQIRGVTAYTGIVPNPLRGNPR